MIEKFCRCLNLPVLICFAFTAFAQEKNPPILSEPAKQWADSVFNTLSEEQRIGQLFMVPAFSNRDLTHVTEITNLINNYHIGGLIFFQGGPVREVTLTNYYQAISKVPLLISMDAEWGISMRLDSTIRFPRQMTLSAMPDDSLIYEMGLEIGRQCRLVGIHVNFAPDIDINNNPFNPVINSRSFSEDKKAVAEKGLLYMHGLQDANVLACGKHFPGHGNTDSDSHFTLPLIRQDAQSIDSVELYPYRKLIEAGLGSVMVAHLYIPSLDSTPEQASTLSRKIVTDLLKEKLGFKGLIFTDALNMKGVTSYTSPGMLELRALQAGNDILLNAENVPLAAETIHYAIQNCELDENSFNESVKKILATKYWAGLHPFRHLDTENLEENLKTEKAGWLNYRLYQNAQTLLINKHNILPFKNLDQVNIASLVINDTIDNVFQQTLKRYAPVSCYQVSKDADERTIREMMKTLAGFGCVIVSIHNTSTNAVKNFNITPQISQIIKTLNEKTKTVVVVFGNAYVLSKIDDAERCEGLLLAYEDTYLPQYIAPQILFGAIPPAGKLPVTPSGFFSRNEGLHYAEKASRLKFTMPAESGLTEKSLSAIDSIAIHGIEAGAYPGCQILVAHKGNIIYQKSFGYQEYDSSSAVRNTDLYDLASVTKIAATALATMKLVEKGAIDPDKKISKYLPELKKSNKKDITIREMLAHQAGFKAWIPFYEKTLKEGKPSYDLYHSEPDVNYSIRVADSLYIKNDYPEKIWNEIIASDVKEKGNYLYSDLDLIIMQKIIEKVSDMPLDAYVSKYFYAPLGLDRLTFHPLSKFDRQEIIPTEEDTLFRHRLIRGDVHDPAAAMMGGVGGHAGVFADAGSLAIIMQMLLNGGTYGEKRYLKKETIDAFTKRQYPLNSNRRGMIFDKPEYDRFKNGPTAKSASMSTFGHTGFTGTCAWADPDKQLVYIFLSNRVNPSAANNKLATMNIRTDIHQVIYDLLK